MLKKLAKRDKGFTLVEVIVVLVIIAILAAILIPSLTGYIDKANERALIAETRSCVMAAQTLVSEDYAGVGSDTPSTANIAALAEVAGTITFDYTSTTYVDGGKVIYLVYSDGTNTCTYDNGEYSFS